MKQIVPGRFTRAAIHADAGEVEVRLSNGGNWQLFLRAAQDLEWRLACSGDMEAGSLAPDRAPRPEPTRLGELLVDREARRALVGDVQLKLGAYEFDLLAALASAPDRVFTKQELMRDIWGREALRSSRTLESHASRVRTKLSEAGAEGLVVNFRGVGYKLWESAPLEAPTPLRAA